MEKKFHSSSTLPKKSIVMDKQEKIGGGCAPMKAKRKLNYRIHNPNSAETTAKFIVDVFMEVNAEKVEKAVRESLQQTKEVKEVG